MSDLAFPSKNCFLVVVPTANPSARSSRLLEFLSAISGDRIVAGIHNDLKSGGPSHCTDRLSDIIGESPALWGGDFLFDERMEKRWEMIYEAERQWKAGAVVNLMWHASPPNQGHSCGWEGGILSRLGDSEWLDLVTEGGALNRVWKERMDGLVPYLEYLRDRDVEVLWRPLHEMNQAKFWWGGRPGPDGSSLLYRLTREYLIHEKGLTNLVWTWSVQDLAIDWGGYNPGPECFDIMTLDVYGKGFSDAFYRAMVKEAGSKPIGLGEVAKMPPLAVLARQFRYCLVMGWADLVFLRNTGEELQRFYRNARVLTGEEMPGWGNT